MCPGQRPVNMNICVHPIYPVHTVAVTLYMLRPLSWHAYPTVGCLDTF